MAEGREDEVAGTNTLSASLSNIQLSIGGDELLHSRKTNLIILLQ